MSKLTLPVLSAGLLLFGFGVSPVHAANAPTFSYDEVAQTLTIQTSDGSPFNYMIGTDQLGNGIGGFFGTTSFTTTPGIFGDAEGSEWIITNDSAASTNPPCNIPQYTGDSQADFANCIAAIEANGGTYEIGSFGVVPLLPGTQPDVQMSTPTNAMTPATDLSSYSVKVPSTPGGVGHMDKTGFVLTKGALLICHPAGGVASVDGRLVTAILASGAGKPLGKNCNYVRLLKDYSFASPSQAASLIQNNLVDGWSTWKKGSKTLGQIYHHTS